MVSGPRTSSASRSKWSSRSGTVGVVGSASKVRRASAGVRSRPVPESRVADGERVDSGLGADEAGHPAGGLAGVPVAGGVDEVGQGEDPLGHAGVAVLGVAPCEPGLADRVGLPFAVVIVVGEPPVVEVVEDLDLVVCAEELLVGAERLRRRAEPGADALAQADLLLDLVVRDQVDVHGVGLLPDAVHAAGALDEPDDRPGQVVVDDDVAVLEVLPFGEDVRGDQDVDRVLRVASPRRASGPGAGWTAGRTGGRRRRGRRSLRWPGPRSRRPRRPGHRRRTRRCLCTR